MAATTAPPTTSPIPSGRAEASDFAFLSASSWMPFAHSLPAWAWHCTCARTLASPRHPSPRWASYSPRRRGRICGARVGGRHDGGHVLARLLVGAQDVPGLGPVGARDETGLVLADLRGVGFGHGCQLRGVRSGAGRGCLPWLTHLLAVFGGEADVLLDVEGCEGGAGEGDEGERVQEHGGWALSVWVWKRCIRFFFKN
jgi:hypothetical protein